jgi:hypothetical protein
VGSARAAAGFLSRTAALVSAQRKRREAPPEDCGGIWTFNEPQGRRDDPFEADEVTEALADLAKVLVPVS